MPDFKTPLVGAHFRPPAKALLQCLPADCALRLVPEPDNPYDENAIKVLVESGSIPESQHGELHTLAQGYGYDLDTILAEPEWHLGYIPRDIAAQLVGRFSGPMPATLGFAPDGKPQVRFTLKDES